MIITDLDAIRVIDARIAAALRSDNQWGTVSERSDAANAQVVFDGSSSSIPVKVPGSLEAFAGDRVALIKVGTHWIIIHTMTQRLVNEVLNWSQMSVATTTSATASEMSPNLAMTFTKRWNQSGVIATVNLDVFWQSVTNNVAEFGLKFIGSSGTWTYAIKRAPSNWVGAHEHPWGAKRISGGDTWGSGLLPADTYEVRLTWRRISGTGTLSTDTDSQCAIICREVA